METAVKVQPDLCFQPITGVASRFSHSSFIKKQNSRISPFCHKMLILGGQNQNKIPHKCTSDDIVRNSTQDFIHGRETEAIPNSSLTSVFDMTSI